MLLKQQSVKPAALPALTGARFFAALAVIFFHCASIIPLPHWLDHLASQGNVGVCFFFVLSGFVLTYNYTRAFERGVSLGQYARFLQARAARILPMHVVALILMTPVTLWLLRSSHWFVNTYVPTGISTARLWESWLLNLFLMQVYIPRLDINDLWNPPAWSIACEIVFYAAFPLLITWILGRLKTARSMLTVAALWWAISAAAFAVTLVMISTHVHKPSERMLWMLLLPYRNPLLRITEFIVGCCVGQIYVRAADSAGGAIAMFATRKGRHLALLLCLVLMALMAAVDGKSQAIQALRAMQSFVLPTPVFALAILALASGDTILSWLLESRPVVLLGEASYSLYLTHWLFVVIVMSRQGDGGHVGWKLVVFGVAGCVLASIAFYEFIEKPARSLLRPTRATKPQQVPLATGPVTA